MKLHELIGLALRSLRANKLRSILTTLGIIIGVLAVILLVSLGSGLQKYITNQISSLGSNLIFVIPGNSRGGRTPGGVQANKLEISDAKLLQTKLRDIATVGPIIQNTTTIKYGNKSNKNTAILGSTANYPDIVKTEVEKGSFFTASQERSGARVALIGQTVNTNFFANKNPIGEKIAIGTTKYTIIGVIKKRGSVFGIDQDNTAIIPITASQRQFGIKNVNVIYLSAKNASLTNFVKKQAQAILLKRLSEDDFTIQSQEQTLDTVNSITGVLTIALGGIAAISLLVGGIGIMNIMLVSVTERTKEIGLRKALGARRKDILNQFLFEAVILSLSGGIVGIILRVGFSYILSKFFVSDVTPWSVFLSFFFSVAIGGLLDHW